MLRDPETRDAYAIVRADKARMRKERKAQAIAYVKTRAAVPVPGQRNPRLRDNIYLAWIRRLPCIACGTSRGVEAMHIRSGYAEAGWAPTGMQQKPDDVRTAPGCAMCHREGPNAQHKGNERAWWSALGIHPPDLCRDLRAAFMAGQEGAPVIAKYRPAGGASSRPHRVSEAEQIQDITKAGA